VRQLDLRPEKAWPGAGIAALTGAGAALGEASVRAEGETLRVDLGREVAVGEGQTLALTLRPR
jgi:hypothetical protein